MKLFTFYNNKKRAISPVIAVILLIGLAVAASAAIFLVVMPLFAPTSSLELNDAFVLYDDAYTKAVEDGDGHGIGTMTLSNSGTGDVSLVSYKVYSSILVTGPWTEVTGAASVDEITNSNPYVLEPLTTFDSINIRFPLPDVNDDSDVYYRLVVETSGDRTVDSTKFPDIINEDDMKLSSDRPTISTTTLGTIRRTHTVAANSADDNSEIKQVVFDVLPRGGGSSIQSRTITEGFWRWNWNTRNTSSLLGDATYGLPNGDYSMNITVYDYAGLSASVPSFIDFTIDNDYVIPNIENILGSSNDGGPGMAEVGTSYSIQATITDSGSAVSKVSEAFIYYKLDDPALTTYAVAPMTPSTGNLWIGNIPAAFVDSEALDKKLVYNISAVDDDANVNGTNNVFADVNDTTIPDFTSHTPVTTAIEQESIAISATVIDRDAVASVSLVWRKRNDTGLYAQYGPWKVSTNVTGSGNIWNFEIPTLNSTLDGIEYYLNASDPTGNMASDGDVNSPYRIVIPDSLSPEIAIRTPTPIPTQHNEGKPLTVSVYVSDHDLTFSRTSDETGLVELGYRRYPDSYTYVNMSHILGDSSTGALGIWEANIPMGVFSSLFPRVDFHVKGTDASSNEKITTEYSITVLPGGTPILEYVTNTASITGPSESILSFDVKNTASDDLADATITDIQVELYNRSKLIKSGTPYITQINASINEVWSNTSASQGANATRLLLDTTFDIGKGVKYTMKIVFANSSGGYYNLKSFKVNVTFFYNYSASGPQLGESYIIFRTPLAEPDYTTYTNPTLNGGRYYINAWMFSPLYPYGGNWGWQTESFAPWTSSEYSRAEIAEGLFFPYTKLGAPTGDPASHTSSTGNDEWVARTFTSGYQINLDTVVGGTSDHYLWLYAVVVLPPSYGADTVQLPVYMGSDDEAILLINGDLVAQRTSPRGFSESGTINYSTTLKGNGQNNYILFGVHEDGGSYSGSVGIATASAFTIKIYDQGPPVAPIRALIKPVSDLYSQPLDVYEENPNVLYYMKEIQTVSLLDRIKEISGYCPV